MDIPPCAHGQGSFEAFVPAQQLQEPLLGREGLKNSSCSDALPAFVVPLYFAGKEVVLFGRDTTTCLWVKHDPCTSACVHLPSTGRLAA